MKIKRLLLVGITSLLVLTGCNVSTEKNNTNTSDKDTTQQLNITQADLIADVTENAKYLNKDLLYDIQTLEDTDKVGVIITLDNDGVLDSYQSNTRGYDTLNEYSTLGYGATLASNMLKEQEDVADSLMDNGLIQGVKHSYTTLFNGFSVETTYGRYKKLVKLGVASEITISEVYSMPQSTTISSDAVENEVDVYETGIFDSSNVGYTGMNTSVAILDSGFDVHHSVFKNMPDSVILTKDSVKSVLSNTSASSFTSGLKVEDVYLNKKIPFVYDYADKDPDVAPYDSNHGTHVAGIIGGSDDVITGVAVDTQLVLMKVFGDVNNGAMTEDILAALEDAVLLGVDAINLSLGTSCGFASSADNEYINEVYQKIEDAGISMIVAASNDYSSGYGGEQSNTSKASNPDSASVGSPGTYSTALSVASVSGVKSKYITTEDGYVFFFNEANSSGTEPYDFYEMLSSNKSLNFEEGKDIELEYVTIPGYGQKVNYAGISVKGKVALVRRGDISFEEKAAIAYSQGAIACIVYNNIGGDILMSAGNDLEIPFCSISKDDGEYLAAKSSGKLIFNTQYLAGPFMSDFSSWGPNPDLTLKPEITAHGGSILSAVHGGGYEEISGTSMACPNMTGVIILLRQYIKENFTELNSVEVLKMANQLAMSTATIILNEEGNPYSPRKQGSGLANLREALATMAYLTVDGCDKAKIELYDDKEETGVYVLEFNLNNLSNQSLTYSLSNFTMTESLSTSDPEYIAEKAYMLSPSEKIEISGDGSIDGKDITVNPNGTVKITYTLSLNDEDIAYIRKSFENGMYVEGYAVLTSKNSDGIDLSIPFLAFFGDWTEAPIFDKTYYEVEAEKNDNGIDEEDKLKADYYATTPLGTYYYSYIIPLGSYVYEIDESKYDPISASEEHASIGYNLETINGITSVYAGLLRNVKKMTTTIVNSVTGEVVYEHIKYDQIKAHYSGGIIPAYDLIEITAAELGLENNTKYTFTMQAELDYEDGGVDTNLNNTFTFSFYVDYEVPLITNAEFYAKYDKSLKENRYYVDVYVYDNHYAQSIRPFTLIDGEISMLSDYATPVYSEKGGITKVTMEITDYMDLLQYGYTNYEDAEYSISNGLGFMVDDYALNAGYYFVTLPGTDVDSSSDFTFIDENGKSTSSYLIEVGQELDLTKYLISNDPTFDADALGASDFLATLNWKSSNEDIVRVKNGKIEGISAGRAKITISTMNSAGNTVSKSVNIVVTEATNVAYSEDGISYSLLSSESSFSNNVSLSEIKFTYFDTLKAFLNGPDISEIGETGDRLFLTNKTKISFYPSEQVQLGYEISPWNLDPSRYELTWSSTNPAVATVDENGVVTAIKEGSANITLRIKVDGKLSNLMAKVSVEVKSEFIIENRTLVAYKGAGGDVVIPDDEGIMYIGAYAFSLYTTDYEIKIDETDYDAAKTPGENNTIKSVTIPYDVLEVQKNAFYNCKALETVIFEKGPKDEVCDIIREYAFYGCESLVNIDLKDVMIIGEEAFKGCTSLVDVNFKKIYALGKRAFMNCTSLKYVDITTLRNVAAEVFLNCTSLTSFDSGQYTNFSDGMFKNTSITEVTYYYDRIPNNLFLNCKSLTTVKIINDIIYVGQNAFSSCINLTSVEFNGSCDFIYDNAFTGDVKLESVLLPNSSVEIEANAFKNCSLLTDVKFNENTYITKNLGSIFDGCSSLSTFVVNSNNPYYAVKDNLLLDSSFEKIILATPNYNYGTYTIDSSIVEVAQGAFSGISSLTNLIINNGNIVIDEYAFSNCVNLESVTLPNENILVLAHAFDGCVKLTTVDNIDLLQEYNSYVFYNTALTVLTLPDNANICDYAFSNIPTLTSVTLGDNTTVGLSAFMGNKALVEVIMGEDIEIGDYAFQNCSSIATIDLSKAINRIGDYAFQNCSSLTTLDLANIKEISNYAFVGCTKLESVSMPNVEVIGDYAFTTLSTNATNANQLTELVLPDTLTYIGDYAFSKNNYLTTVTIGNGLTKLGKYAFANCSKLVTVSISSNLDTIAEGAFVEDSSLTTLTANNIQYVNDYAFYSCSKLANIDLTKVIVIGIEAFAYCSSLTEANLLSATYLDKGAFRYATSLAEVYAPKIEIIDEQALSVTDITVFVIPNTISYVAPTAFYANYYLTKFEYSDGATSYESYKINDYALLDNGVLYTTTENGKYTLNSYPAGKDATEYSVIDGTVRIEYCAMAYAASLKNVIFPDTLKLIGNMALYGCKALETVEFRSTVAPTLEGTIMEIGVDYTELEIYEILAKYFPFNGVYPLYYAQFIDLIGTVEPLNIILPSNKALEGYDNLLYTLYFDVDSASKSTYVAKDQYTIDYLDKIILVPNAEDVNLNDKAVIANARTAYNLLKQDLTDFGYEQEYLDEMYARLVAAEEVFTNLMMQRINVKYEYLIADINALGSTYNYDKISEYYAILEALKLVDKDDLKYIDQTNVDKFKSEYTQYFNNITNEVKTLDEISNLPTTSVNKVGLAVVSVTNGLAMCLAVVFKKFWFM